MTYTYMLVLIFVHLRGICFVSGSQNIYRTKQHHRLNDLVRDFSNIIQKPAAEFIDLSLEHEDAFDREATGIYKLIPYYVKIYPKDTNHGDRFIIQQNPFNDEFQLVKIFNYINHKNVRSLFHPNKEVEQKKDLTTINCFLKYQTNVKALAEKNIQLIEEIQSTKKQSNNFKENLQSKEKQFLKNMEQEKRKMKEKKFKLKEQIFQLKLKNIDNEQTICDLQQTMEPKQSLINEQKIMIEKLQLELSQLKYEKECLQDENSNLTNQLKTTKENLNRQEKDKNKKLQKQKKEIQKENENLQKKNKQMHAEQKLTTPSEQEKEKRFEHKQETKFQKENQNLKKDVEEKNLSQLLCLEEKWKKLDMYKHNLDTIQLYFQNYYFHFSQTFPNTVMNLSTEHQLRLKQLFENEMFEYKPMFEYEQALMAYGFFKHVEKFRLYAVINIPETAIFDPKKLELPTSTSADNKQKLDLMIENK